MTTVRDLLDTPLDAPRVRSLEAACDQLAARPLEDTIAELRTAVAQPVTGEGGRRLHVLVSTLYHRAGASLELTKSLRAEIEAAQTAEHTEEDHHVVPERELP